MAGAAVTAAPRSWLAARLDAATSRLFRLDLSRTDVVKWVDFARQLLAVLLFSVVTIAALSAFVSTRLARELLVDSLDGEARAIAAAAAQAAFVPLTLEDDQALAALAESYRGIEHLGALRIRDARGRVRAEMKPRGPLPRTRSARAEILPVLEEAPRARSPEPAGAVEVDMRTTWIDAKTREIALTNATASGGVAALLVLVGVIVIRNLVDRTRELVGEARLVAEVKRVNAELEAFSYSVAHDLRAPLRSIDGFSQVLLENYADKLDEPGKDYLRRVRAGSRRMGQLINDLLELSRVTRGDLRRERVDLSRLAHDIAVRLRASAPERSAEFVVEKELWVVGDLGLMRAALENLLGNAWKYTSRRPAARIEFGARREGRRTTYFVRDDGAGFDMAFADKLFKPFSRLHSPGEFEGTGIGLATVQRIIERHGGRIWGEGATGRGAVFYFTLGERP